MDWQLKTFAAVFVAELGDKTQLATMARAASASSRWTVFGGAALALGASSAVAVLAGAAVSRAVSPLLMQRVAGLVFVAIGLVYLFSGGSAR